MSKKIFRFILGDGTFNNRAAWSMIVAVVSLIIGLIAYKLDLDIISWAATILAAFAMIPFLNALYHDFFGRKPRKQS